MPEKLLLVFSLQNCRLPNQAGSRTRRKSIGKDELGDNSLKHPLNTFLGPVICSGPLSATAGIDRPVQLHECPFCSSETGRVRPRISRFSHIGALRRLGRQALVEAKRCSEA